ncbi:hypothetical protein IWT25_00171 [Secundilactobacillus pentosiphilus]|uniref:Surface layer protein A domain-containing protein n=1 Tax=Secundilactobacillus pentosiphilus TaxID=1714682 RepID=A0A1Z5ISX8_9LACO|nr:hypothetical protein [Secundilactobacillus pentosiphilus]GAX04877.1 hypothetical protein IWT25_00171 [Secundilactobacillus pentosiphilus]
MKHLVAKSGLTALTSLALFGGASVLATDSNTPSFSTVAKAATVSQSQLKSDVQTMVAARNEGGNYVKEVIDGEQLSEFSDDPMEAYNDERGRGFGQVPGALHYELSQDFSMFNQDYAGLMIVYNGFKDRFSSTDQAVLAQDIKDINSAKNSEDKAEKASAFGNDLGSAVDNYGATVTKIESASAAAPKPAAPKPAAKKTVTKKSYVSKLTAKKTSSKKYVKITGTVKLYKSAKYAYISTYKGHVHVKLNSKHQFSKTVYAPKAKHVKVKAGSYSHGHFKAVTSYKTVTVH